MIGGTIVQIVGEKIEVLESQSCDRCWRRINEPGEVEVGDTIWWMEREGYASRLGRFTDKSVGSCTMTDAPTKAEMETA